MSSNNVRIYRGLARRERAGWIMGLTPWQALTCILLAVPVLWTVSAGQFLDALALATVCGVAACLVVVPVRGRPAFRWLWHLVRYQAGIATGWSRWQSRAAAGAPVDPGEPDLPGALQRVNFPDGPVFKDRGRVCLIHDTGDGRWGATARLTHTGVGMLSDEQCERLASRLGNLLLSIGHRDVVDRMSLLVRTVPDDGTEYEVWRGRHEVTDAPPLARRAADELDRTIGSVSVRHEVFVTLSGSEDALRKPAAAAGGGADGRARVLYRVLDGLEDPLKALGAESVEWLSGAGLAEAMRTGFNPASSAALRTGHLTGDGTEGLPMAAAGPTEAPAPAWRRYDHDAYSTVSYSVLMPEAGTVFGSLSPLLAVKTAGERRCLALHYEVMDARRASRAVQNYRFRAGVLRDYKATKGFSASASDEREAGGALAQERAVAAGHSIVRYAAAAAVTVPASWNVEDHAARLENDASGRFRLLRLDLAQDSAFVAACLPVGIGLPRSRSGLL
ncbi:SCO6880 family protein [Saccharopolyspora cebuensis]|uniref:SCO6880 family protein n=1 Tax=Saccharopolyspora cebuensis TaxID=418759 RepID=A0ABV4CMN0_9PSEU